MASAFWTLEDGRGFATKWSAMAHMLELITDELKTINEAEDFYHYLEKFVYREENGDESNGYGGFIRGDKSVMFNFDLRNFTTSNQYFFWEATQRALAKLNLQKINRNEGIIFLLTTLLDMHERIKRGEDPDELNHMRTIKPQTNEKLGPGWL